MEKTVKGVDISTLLELEKLHAKYYDNGICEDLVSILAAHGVDGVRLRLWNSPFDNDGIAYGGGTDDLITVIEIARRCKAAGMSFFLDLHYSDFWADAGKQTKPKAWKDYSVPKLCDAVKRYTISVLEYLEAAGVCPDMVQPGNEISNGLLWPEGKFPEYEAVLRFLKAATEGIRSFNNDIKIVLHLAAEPEHPVYSEFMDVFGRELDYDVIGISYFPYKKTYGLSVLEENIRKLADRYGKQICLVETAMPYTTEDYAEREKLRNHARKGMAAKNAGIDAAGLYEVSVEGQKEYLTRLIELMMSMPEVMGFYYWEPAWIPVVGSGWATSASLKYLGVSEPCGNEWANQALFDYEGNALPALKVYMLNELSS